MSKVTADNLNDVMGFDHVIRVTANGEVEDGPEGEYAPELSIGDADDMRLVQQAAETGWELMHGYSGQYSFNGPVMHASEYIGGRMAEDILKGPGLYVAVTVEIDDPDEEDAAGWAVAFKADE